MSAAWRALLAVAGNRLSYGHAHGSPPAVPGQPAAADVADVLHHWGLDDASWQEASPQSHRHEPWYAVLGHPVAHSLSPHLHNAALQHTPVAANATVPSMCQTATRLCAWCRWSPTGSAWRAQA
jgi:hypothetical protein